MLALGQLGTYQDPQVLQCGAGSQLGGHQHVLGVAWNCSSPGAGLAILLVQLHEILVSSSLQTAEIPLDGSKVPWGIRRSPQLCVICKFTEGVLYPLIQIVDVCSSTFVLFYQT